MNDIRLTEADMFGISSATGVGEMMKIKEEREAREDERQRKLLAPVVQALNTQVEELRKENKQREIEVENAKIEAQKAKIFSWITFGITTLIAIASLIVAIIAMNI